MLCRRYLSVTVRRLSIESTDLLQAYKNAITRGDLLPDEIQLRTIYQLRDLHAQLHEYDPDPTLLDSFNAASSSTSQTAFPLNLTKRSEKALVRLLTSEEKLMQLDTPRGFLLTGPPGTGKSLIMDLFFKSLPTNRKLRRHYDPFLLGLYHRTFQHLERQRMSLELEERQRNADPVKGYPWSRKEEAKALAITKGWRKVFAGGRDFNDPALKKEFVLACIARDLIRDEGWFLAFDEIQLVDVAGASIVRRVLEYFWKFGGVVCGTSNRVPDDLYQHGIQREQFLTFISLLENRCPVIAMDSPIDWRRRARSTKPSETGKLQLQRRSWFLLDERKDFEKLVDEVTGPTALSKIVALPVYGRKINIPQVAQGVARISFAELCGQALGPADYLTLAAQFHTVIIDQIPILPLSIKNEARRFITLIDALYESKVKLICLAEAPQDGLFFPEAAASSEAGDSLLEEALSETLMEPYRPNVSSYDNEAIQEPSADEKPAVRRKVEIGDERHPSADIPAFRNLAIFSGQDERFAFRRAVSRIHELTSPEYWASSVHEPLPVRPWEESIKLETPSLSPRTAQPLPSEALRSDAPRFSTSHFWGMFKTRRTVSEKSGDQR